MRVSCDYCLVLLALDWIAGEEAPEPRWPCWTGRTQICFRTNFSQNGLPPPWQCASSAPHMEGQVLRYPPPLHASPRLCHATHEMTPVVRSAQTPLPWTLVWSAWHVAMLSTNSSHWWLPVLQTFHNFGLIFVSADYFIFAFVEEYFSQAAYLCCA